MGLSSYLHETVREGRLSVDLPGGRSLDLGDGAGPPLR